MGFIIEFNKAAFEHWVSEADIKMAFDNVDMMLFWKKMTMMPKIKTC